MKKIILAFGLILIAFSLYSLIPILSNSRKLSEYGKGYVVGNFIVLTVSLLLIIYGLKKRK